MEELDVTESLSRMGQWVVNNEGLLIQFAVNVVAAIIILLIGLLVALVLSNGISRVMVARGIYTTVADFLAALVRYGIIAFMLIAVLSRIGVQTASVIAVMGVAGLAVGLALQGALSNFAVGVLLVMFRPFRTGEFVDLGGVSGTVTQVQIFSTTIRTPDGKIIVVPNGKIIAGNIINSSRKPDRRTEIIVGVAYDADIEQVKTVLGDIVAADKRIQHERGVTIRLNEMAASSLNFVVWVWTTNGDAMAVKWDLLESFKRVLDEHQIGIPYPQMDVHLHQPSSTSTKA